MTEEDILTGMNPEQKKFIISPLENSKLIGIPGGGKTTTIIKKILYHKNRKDFTSNQEFLIITFSRKACSDFIERGKSLSEGTFSNLNVKTIHSLAGTIMQKMRNKTLSSLDIIIASVLEQVKILEDERLRQVMCLGKLKLMVIDEAQDISDIQYELAKSICDKLKIKLILVGDPNQNIYQFQNGADKYILNHDGPNHILLLNHRSTKEIIDVVNFFRPWKTLLPDMVPFKDKKNKKPTIYSGGMEYLSECLLREINDKTYDPKDIAIIGPVKKSNRDANGFYKNIGLQFFVNLFESKNIKFIKHYNESTKDQEVVNEEREIKSGYVNLYTIHGSKGLEFKKVILLNFHLSTHGRKPTLEDYNRFKYLWYVGLSRAKEDMILLADKHKQIWSVAHLHENLKLFNIVHENPKDSLNVKNPEFTEKSKRKTAITELISNKELFKENILKFKSVIISFKIFSLN